jgi:hypothetical protein
MPGTREKRVKGKNEENYRIIMEGVGAGLDI